MAASLLVAVLIVVSSLVVVVVLDGQRQQTTATLEQALASARDRGIERRDSDDSAFRNVAVAVSDRHGIRTLDGAMPPGLPDRAAMAAVAHTRQAEQRQVEVSGRHFAVRTAPVDGAVLQAVLDLHEQREEIARLLRAIVISSAIGVVLAAGVAMLLGRRAVRPLAEALALQQRFVADAAHELRTPLTLLSTRAQLLGRRLQHARPVNPALRSQLDDAVRGLVSDAANLTEILEDLLLAADRTAELPPVPVDLATVAREAVAAADVAANAVGIHVELTICTANQNATQIPAGSRPAILRAANALIDNAVSHARSQVDVSVIARAGSVVLDVADDGPGIDAETLPRIFDRFASQRPSQRRDANTGPEPRHYGLGLALVSDVAARHGGTVTVERRADGGTGALFRLRFPTDARSAR